MSVWVMPFVDVYENFLKRSQAVAGGRRRSQAVGTPMGSMKTKTTVCMAGSNQLPAAVSQPPTAVETQSACTGRRPASN